MSTTTALPSFDTLLALAGDDPQQLEVLRQQLINELISSAPASYQRRLQGLQFTVDMERRKAKTPMAACIRLSQMMHESFHELRQALGATELENDLTDAQSSAQILPFAR